jgi:hypothetical protein
MKLELNITDDPTHINDADYDEYERFQSQSIDRFAYEKEKYRKRGKLFEDFETDK